jgi:hypothetical protein
MTAIRSTLWCFMDAPAHDGRLIDVRILGIIDAEQTQEGKTEKNSRILGAATILTSTRTSAPYPT